MLMEMVGFRQYVRWNSWVEINPESAREIGVNDGDWVWVESVNDRLRCRARVFAGVQPNMINLPVGLGHTAMGRNAKNRGVNPATVTINDFDPLSGVSSQFGTRVKVYKRQSS